MTQSSTSIARPPKKKARAKKSTRTSGVRRLQLNHLLFALLLLPGILPLLISSSILINRNKETLKTQEQVLLTHSAQQFVGRVSDQLAMQRTQLQQLGRAVVSAPGFSTFDDRLREPWVRQLFKNFVDEQKGDLKLLNATGQDRRGLQYGAVENPQVEEALAIAFDTALRLGQVDYEFAVLSTSQEPAVAMAVPVSTPDGQDVLMIQALVPIDLRSSTTAGEAFEVDDFFLVDTDGTLLWTASSQEQIQQALLHSDLVQDFAKNPSFSVSSSLEIEVGDETERLLARVVEVQETGWGLVAHKSTDVAFKQVQDMVFDTVLSSVLAIMLALFFAIVASRWFSKPIQRLAETSHEIAAGKFDRRVPIDRLMTAEIAEMAGDFNRMGDYVENYIEQLKQAAEANRSLFISSIRAFAAAIDAKDPYTRGHSERVAAYSRSIARYLGLPKDMQERVWIAGVLHDVGKIGVQDRVLLKQGVLSPEEFDQMKQHPVIGADIIEPISALREMLPGIRWHHEAWNGTGYPDRLKGDSIPLMARVIGVADTFDAITTNRPYQTASSTEFAIETIKKLTGTRFDAKVVTAFLLAWEAGHIGLDREKAARATQAQKSPTGVVAGDAEVPPAGPAPGGRAGQPPAVAS